MAALCLDRVLHGKEADGALMALEERLRELGFIAGHPIVADVWEIPVDSFSQVVRVRASSVYIFVGNLQPHRIVCIFYAIYLQTADTLLTNTDTIQPKISR